MRMLRKIYWSYGEKNSTRGLEHQKAVFQGDWDHSALSFHTKECNKGILWEDFCTISTEPNYYRRTIMEALEIQREEVSHPDRKIINDRAGLYVTTDTWKPLLKRIGTSENIGTRS